jgi:AcrR family transcriptional regulator
MIDPHAQLTVRRENDAQLVRGFVADPSSLRDGARKVLAARLRARCVAVDSALIEGLQTSLRSVAERVGVSERNLHQQFRSKDALFAFPPPEFAAAVADVSIGINSWSEVALRIRPLARDLDRNACGRSLFVGLSRLHESYPLLAAGDGHFAHELRERIRVQPVANSKVVLSAGFFTDCLRFAITEWAHHGNQPLAELLDELPELLNLNSFRHYDHSSVTR